VTDRAYSTMTQVNVRRFTGSPIGRLAGALLSPGRPPGEDPAPPPPAHSAVGSGWRPDNCPVGPERGGGGQPPWVDASAGPSGREGRAVLWPAEIDRDIVAREVVAKLIAIVAKFVRHRGKENPHLPVQAPTRCESATGPRSQTQGAVTENHGMRSLQEIAASRIQWQAIAISEALSVS
jgi:hypothetical protein